MVTWIASAEACVGNDGTESHQKTCIGLGSHQKTCIGINVEQRVINRYVLVSALNYNATEYVMRAPL